MSYTNSYQSLCLCGYYSRAIVLNGYATGESRWFTALPVTLGKPRLALRRASQRLVQREHRALRVS